MSKDKSKKKSKATEPELSKKERKALEAREAELAAELAKREAKAKKKAGKKKKAKGEAPTPVPADERKAKSPTAKETVTAAADEALATPSSKGARVAAETAKAAAEEAEPDETPAQIKARIKAKRERRKELADLAESIDRDDAEAVKAYNDELATLGGGEFITSNAEKAKNDERFDNDAAAIEKGLETLEAEVKKIAAVTAVQVTEAVETEAGTVFAVGTSDEPDAESDDPRAGYDFDGANVPADEPDADESGNIPVTYDLANPSEAPRTDFETNGLGQYKIKRPSDGKTVGYTRATTYIKCLEDTSALTKWKLRMLLEGVAINDTPSERGDFAGDPVVAVMRDLIHRRDVRIAKAHKADKKGKLGNGELNAIVEGAWSEFKKAVNTLADELLETGGVHAAANKGTDLHALTEVVDLEGIDAVGAMLERGEITPADYADMIAYRDALETAGIKILKEYVEQVIVRHDLKVAGRLDRVGMVKFPGAQRAVRSVIDLKTGNIEWAPGTIAQQLDIYAHGTGYDLNTHEETDLKINRTKAIVINLRPGSAKATVHVVDLVAGHKANALAGQVRAWRNEGKRAIDLKTDLAEKVAE